jgi:polyphosphate kinase 2 (PPK2 family)
MNTIESGYQFLNVIKQISNKRNKVKTPNGDDYFIELEDLQYKLMLIQQAIIFQKKQAVIVFEGIDAAGKGGVIRRLSWAMDPRGLNVWPINAPSEREINQHYLQRFWTKMPAKGKIAVFDRSWYGRVLVERVEKITPSLLYKNAFDEINSFEQQLFQSDIKVVKIFLKISASEQLKRFKERLISPEKRWKLSFEDFRNRANQKAYDMAFKEMFIKTSTKNNPWWLIESDNKRWARLEALKLIVATLSKGLDLSPPELSPALMKMANKILKQTAK